METITVMQMAKGWAFVLATSVLIFFLMRQEMSRFFKADEAQRASESNFRLLVENSRDFILFIRREDGRILEANTAASAAYGYSRDELLKLRVQDLREPNTTGLVPDQMAKADAEGILFETIHQRKDGTTFPVEVSSKGATVNGMRTLTSVGRDITERKRSEAELRRLATAIEQAAEMVVMTDEKADIVYANPAFEKITGYSQMEVLGKNPRILKSGEQDHAFYQQMWASLSAGKTWRGRFVNKKKNGSLYTEEATISPVLDPSGNIINYVAVKRDITKEQELEQQYLEAQKMEAIGTLAGGIAHDFNNILAIILANAQILEFSGAISSESKETLNQIIIASKRATRIGASNPRHQPPWEARKNHYEPEAYCEGNNRAPAGFIAGHHSTGTPHRSGHRHALRRSHPDAAGVDEPLHQCRARHGNRGWDSEDHAFQYEHRRKRHSPGAGLCSRRICQAFAFRIPAMECSLGY
ncbi:MAG: PAS domain S-box protein [Desulfomicrobium escambiense]|nr:PAS domain S-box protein [Desulfomicrobium escambiense]